jgi:hypothetical protein
MNNDQNNDDVDNFDDHIHQIIRKRIKWIIQYNAKKIAIDLYKLLNLS